MEAKGSSPQWKKHIPAFKHGRLSGLTTKASESVKTDTAGDGHRQSKSVTMAPTSKCLTDRQYIMRKPVFSADQYTSILKKIPSQNYKEKENYLGVSRTEEHQEHTHRNFLTKAKTDLTPESFSLSHRDIPSPSFSRNEIDSPLSVTDIRGSLDHEEAGGRSSQLSFLSSIMDVQRQNPPLRPQLTSTVLNPTYTPRSGYSRSGKSHLTFGERDGETRLGSSKGRSREQRMSTHQANYWACAIPKHLPPSPERYSKAWDPNKEYQALLDYTYPLRPGQTASEWDSSQLQASPQLQTDLNLHDSGIGLEHLNSSINLPDLGLGENSAEHTRERCSPSRGDRSPSSTVLTFAEPQGLCVNSLDTSRDRHGLNRYKSDDHHHNHNAHSSTPAALIQSKSVLQRYRHMFDELDEEFYPLPEQLEELQLLSKQVRELTTRLSRPGTATWESLDPVTTSILSSPSHPEGLEGEDKEETQVCELEDYNQDVDEQKSEMSREKHSAAQTAGHRDSGVRKRSGPSIEPFKEELSQSISSKVDALVEQLCFLTLPSSQMSSLMNQEQSDSLMQNIQVFCSHLEQLIQQLYTMSEKMDQLVPPTLDIDNMKSSLAQYQSFQRDVSRHQPLTSCVLHTGQLLLSCMTSSSLFLRDTLLLIESQSGVLESHREHIFSSLFSAMDSLTQHKSVQQSKEEDSDTVKVQDSTFSTEGNM